MKIKMGRLEKDCIKNKNRDGKPYLEEFWCENTDKGNNKNRSNRLQLDSVMEKKIAMQNRNTLKSPTRIRDKAEYEKKIRIGRRRVKNFRNWES